MAKIPREKRHRLQDATKPLDDFECLARERLGLPPPVKLINPSRRRWLPPLLLLIFTVACLIGFGFQHFRGHGAVVPSPRPLVVSFLNVGQGDSTLIQTPSGKNILIDTGPSGNSSALFNELRLRNVHQLNLLIISHYDSDHVGNALVVIDNFPIGKVVESGLDRFDLTKYKVENEIMRQKIPLVMVAQNLMGVSQDLGDGVILNYLAPKERFQNLMTTA